MSVGFQGSFESERPTKCGVVARTSREVCLGILVRSNRGKSKEMRMEHKEWHLESADCSFKDSKIQETNLMIPVSTSFHLGTRRKRWDQNLGIWFNPRLLPAKHVETRMGIWCKSCAGRIDSWRKAVFDGGTPFHFISTFKDAWKSSKVSGNHVWLRTKVKRFFLLGST